MGAATTGIPPEPSGSGVAPDTVAPDASGSGAPDTCAPVIAPDASGSGVAPDASGSGVVRVADDVAGEASGVLRDRFFPGALDFLPSVTCLSGTVTVRVRTARSARAR